MFIGIDLTIVSLGVVENDRGNVQLLRCDYNEGLQEAVGEYIIFVDSKDIEREDRIEKQLAKIKESGADVCFCDAEVVEGEDFIADGYSGIIPPATIAVANICLSSAMFKVETLKHNIGDERIVKDNPYFWIKALRGAVCVPLSEKLVTVFSNIPYSFRENYGNENQAEHHPLIGYKREYEKIVNSGIYKAASLPVKLTKKIFGDKSSSQ